MDLKTNNAFARIHAVFYVDRQDGSIMEVGSDGSPPGADETGMVSVQINGQHAEATALLSLLQSAVKVIARKPNSN